jgi:hypothetical protein
MLSAIDKSHHKLNLACARAISIAYPELQKLESAENPNVFIDKFNRVQCYERDNVIEISFSSDDFRIRGGGVTYIISIIDWKITETVNQR